MDITTFSIALGLISVLAFGVGNALVKIPSKKYTSLHFLVYKSVITSSVFLVLLLFTYKTQVFDIPMIALAFLIGTLGFVSMSLLYKAFEIGKIGVISPVAASTVVFTLLFTSLLFNLHLTLMQIIAVAVIVVGVVLVKLDIKQIKSIFSHKNTPGLKQALIHVVVMGAYMTLIQIPNSVLGTVLYPLIGEIAIGIYSFAYIKSRGEKIVVPNKKYMKTIIFISLIMAIGQICIFNGLKYGNPMIFLPIFYASPPVVVLLGYYLYHERLRKQQYIAVMTIVIGVIMLKLVS